MQQTETYKLNLIEPSDPSLPDGLNTNTQKIENAMTAHEAAVEAVTDGLDARIAVLEGHKLAIGRYDGTGTEQTILVGFTPKVVYIRMAHGTSTSDFLFIDGDTSVANSIKTVAGGFRLLGARANDTIYHYNYIAFV